MSKRKTRVDKIASQARAHLKGESSQLMKDKCNRFLKMSRKEKVNNKRNSEYKFSKFIGLEYGTLVTNRTLLYNTSDCVVRRVILVEDTKDIV